MFTIPRTNVVESDEGFSLEVLGRTGIRFTEQGKTMHIDSEVLQGPSGLIMYTDSITKWDDGENVDERMRNKIVENIRAAFRFRGLEIQVR
jgi:hypothetical protein